MSDEEIVKLAKQIPEYVVNAFHAIRKEYSIPMLVNVARSNDGVLLGHLCSALYEIDKSVIKYLQTADGGLIDSEKLELSIIALNLAYKNGSLKKE